MKTVEAVREVMKTSNVSVSNLAKRIECNQSTLSERLTQENISVKKLNEMLRAMDYKIIIVPNGTRHIEGGIEIE